MELPSIEGIQTLPPPVPIDPGSSTVRREREVDEKPVRFAKRRFRREESREDEDRRIEHSGETATHSLGISSLVLGIFAIVVSVIPCAGILALPIAGVGLLLGLIAGIISLARSGKGIGYPIAGTFCNGLALGIFLLWMALFSSFADVAANRGKRPHQNAHIIVDADPVEGKVDPRVGGVAQHPIAKKQKIAPAAPVAHKAPAAAKSPAPVLSPPTKTALELEREQAEAETAKINEQIQQEHQKKIQRLKLEQEHQLQVYELAKKDHETAIKAFEVDRHEYEANAKLRVIHTMYVESLKSREKGKGVEGEVMFQSARKRARDLMEKYPTTASAKSAMRFLSDGKIAAPNSLTPPMQPAKAPTMPLPLRLPPQPEKIPVVYPEDIRAAEAARKADEELEINGLVLLQKTLSGRNGSIGGEITGLIENRRGMVLNYVQINFTLHDASGTQVGTALANTNDLEAGGRWRFRAVTFGQNFASFKVSRLFGR